MAAHKCNGIKQVRKISFSMKEMIFCITEILFQKMYFAAPNNYMTLFEKLQQARSEEDVKDAYIKALGLKGYSKNLIDIQTKEIWFEAKDNSRISTYAMFTQLMHYVQHDAKC